MPPFAFISLGASACFLVVLLFLSFNVEKLTALGLFQPLYYLILVPMAVGFAYSLSGSRRSSAAYEGELLGGKLKLGGPVVVAALIVVGGYVFIPKATTFPLTVFVHGPEGPQDVVLRNSGHVVLQLGPDVRKEAIGENGQAYFPAIPANFRSQEVAAFVESDNYSSVDPGVKRRLGGESLSLIVDKKITQFKLEGTISDEFGNALAEVLVTLPELNTETRTNRHGRFALQVSTDSQRTVSLVVKKSGYRTANLHPTLGDDGVNFSLERNP